MDLFILIILLKSISFCIGLSKLELHCNFSKYMLNFFKHNEKYLLHLEKRNNIQPVDFEDLNTYGKALKTHGEIIMAMLDTLRPFSKRSTAHDLMSINLYLNNVSGSLNFITRNCSGKYNRNLSNVLRGYQLHHRTIVDELNEFINNKCTNVTVDEDFIKCPDYNKSGIYNIKDLPKIAEKLKNRFTNYNVNNTATMVNINEIFNALLSSLNSNKYNDFDPKNLLFFYLLNDNVDHRPFTINSNDVQFTLLKNKKKLDLLRYATVKFKCPNNTYLNITDVFQYMLYSFNAQNMITFQELVITATIQPIIKLVRIYNLNLKNLSSFVSNAIIKKNEINFFKIVKIGVEIVKNLDCIIHLNILNEYPESLLYALLKESKNIISCYKNNILYQSNTMTNIVNTVQRFLKSNRLDITFGTTFPENFIEYNFDSLFSIVEDYSQKVTAYITGLKSFKQIYKIVNKTYYFKYFYVSRNKNFFCDDVIEYICNQRSYTNLFNKNNVIDIQTETKTEVDKNDDFTFDIEDSINNLYTEIVESSETSNQEVDFVSCTIPESQTKNRPEYIKDYLLFSNLS
ncbi:uncharacterized protein LOC126894396 isoform X15 [Daktulosphaira vitifoliae]|uniref:uncharacterized protein LOC126894396 isoform X15 n=1 Tax=Daktulosphaira vitifoliae TaxID=58002 RepID=UPI0021AA7B98|nr:uncharacterized protein LOC126894396 isoform X15 [Daktulosphaira vitifoliae]